MKEIEVLVMIQSENFEGIRKRILKEAKLVSKSSVLDTYYYDPLRDNLKPNEDMAITECFRLRRKDEKAYLTYKVDRFDDNGKWLYSDEDESAVQNADEVGKIISDLGLRELVVVDSVREYYENDCYTFAIEFVKNLGAFLEVESKTKLKKLEDINKEKDNILKFISTFGFDVSSDVGIGKPELLLRKLAKK